MGGFGPGVPFEDFCFQRGGNQGMGFPPAPSGRVLMGMDCMGRGRSRDMVELPLAGAPGPRGWTPGQGRGGEH